MSKCKFIKKCPHFSNESKVCMKDGGMYYADATEPAGCYRKMEGNK